MVKLEEVTEGHDDLSDKEPSDNESDSSEDSDSEEFEEESFLERIFALRDIVPEETRESITHNISAVMRFGARSAQLIGNGAWILTTSALLIFMPLAYEIEREHAFDQAYSQMENEQLMVGQQPGQSIPQQPRGALIPPGF